MGADDMEGRLEGALASTASSVELRDFTVELRALLKAYHERGRALGRIAEGYDSGRHDGFPEDYPAHDADTMFAIARAALNQKGDER